MRLRLVVGFQILQWALLGALAQAQAGTQPLPELPPPPPPADSAPAATPQAPPAGPEGGAEACVPACRSGFMCQSGVCISACNPPCPAGQECTAQGECIYPYQYPQQPMYPAPMYPPPPPALLDRPPPLPPPPGSYEHDGFLLRGGFGIGFTATEQSPSRANTSFLDSNFTGVAIGLNVDVGFAPVTNFILQARFGYMITPDPRISVDGSDETVSGDFSLGTLLVAPGLTYYFMPINLYITGAVGLAWFTFDSDRVYDYDGYDYDDNTDTTSAGIGLNLDVGKEWWVGRQWGIGVAARMSFAAATGEVVSGRYDYTQWGFTILFSATLQ